MDGDSIGASLNFCLFIGVDSYCKSENNNRRNRGYLLSEKHCILSFVSWSAKLPKTQGGLIRWN